MPEPWFSISGEDILKALRDVAAGTKPEVVYALLKIEARKNPSEDHEE